MEVMKGLENISEIRLFGSFARAEQTVDSDYDILVILQKSQQITSELKTKVYSLFEREISISWYNQGRIKQMYEMGHLFAWHIFQESKPLFIFNEFISTLGEPKPYEFFSEDVWSLIEILKPTKASVERNSRNLIYEAGLAYVCVRNIAICASPFFGLGYRFGVNAPLAIGIPMEDSDFELLKQCRYASIRGYSVPKISSEKFFQLYDLALKWGTNILEKKQKENDQHETSLSEKSRV